MIREAIRVYFQPLAKPWFWAIVIATTAFALIWENL